MKIYLTPFLLTSALFATASAGGGKSKGSKGSSSKGSSSKRSSSKGKNDCQVDVEIDDCNLEDDGRSCDSIEPPVSTSCATGESINAVTFSYQDNTCDPSKNNQGDEAFCEDCAPLIFFDPVTVQCRNDATGAYLAVTPSNVLPGAPFTITSPGGGSLPNKVDCAFFAQDGTKIQQNVIDTSGDVQLELQDDFGAFRLESCNELTCLETLCYDIEIENVGTMGIVNMAVDFMFNGEIEDLGNQGSLEPRASKDLKVKREVNTCSTAVEEYCALVNVEAVTPNGIMCQDDDELKIQVP